MALFITLIQRLASTHAYLYENLYSHNCHIFFSSTDIVIDIHLIRVSRMSYEYSINFIDDFYFAGDGHRLREVGKFRLEFFLLRFRFLGGVRIIFSLKFQSRGRDQNLIKTHLILSWCPLKPFEKQLLIFGNQIDSQVLL